MKILILPDIHGRDFWKEPCQNINNFDKVIFLGDYHDPYTFQVSRDKSMENLRELVKFIEEHKDKITCLIGNHDLSYLISPCSDRYDRYNAKEVEQLIRRMPLQLILQIDNYLFSHSGVLPLWIEENDLKIEELNNLSLGHPALTQVSPNRGGYDKVGSCVWGDLIEYNDAYHYADYYQIFGHTQLKLGPFIQKDFACLDCREAFILDTETKKLKSYQESLKD